MTTAAAIKSICPLSGIHLSGPTFFTRTPEKAAHIATNTPANAHITAATVPGCLIFFIKTFFKRENRLFSVQ
ncbi:MAG: hypothetical protein BWY61_00599 [Firmicutes bacterium ADurb.Bin354]|nr:MAG: hypothetical protein BWY61_00599 [Firmicutes bacterium ADurb.Bin354]